MKYKKERKKERKKETAYPKKRVGFFSVSPIAPFFSYQSFT
ncbi:MAG: hypothetical protein ACQESX_02195 [Bacteroidota bacterium]